MLYTCRQLWLDSRLGDSDLWLREGDDGGQGQDGGQGGSCHWKDWQLWQMAGLEGTLSGYNSFGGTNGFSWLEPGLKERYLS